MELKEINNKKYFNKGQTAKCYLLENGNILKLFNNKRDLSEIDRFKYMMEYANESFIFPFEFIYDSKKFHGYITKRAPGIIFESCFSKSNLVDLSKNSRVLERDIDYVSEGGITLYDFHDQNVLYDGKRYSVIDHDENGIYKSVDYAKNFNRESHRIMIGKLFEKNIEKGKDTEYILDKVCKYKYSDMRPSEMIGELKQDIDFYFKEDIKTVEELNSIIRK